MNESPFVSLIMPIRNEADFIERSLGTVLSQEHPAESMEIIVVDGMSTDETRKIVGEMMKRDSRISLLDNPKQIAPTALNIGTHAAKGDIIIRVDGHCEIEKDYVSRCVEHLSSGIADGVGGSIETIGDGFIASVIAIAMSSRFGMGGSAFRTVKEKTMFVDTIAFPAYRRDVIEAAGEYDEEMVRNQDDEYNYRLRKMGYRLMLAEDVRSRYHSRASFGKLAKQFFQYGFWKVRVLQKHPFQMSVRQFVPSVFVLSLLFSIVVGSFSSTGWIPLIGILASYLSVAGVFAIRDGLDEGFSTALLLPLAYLIIHSMYGAGMIVGFFRFLLRWKTASFKSIPDSAKA